MKKTFRLSGIILLAIIVWFGFVACKGTDKGSNIDKITPTKPEEMSGKTAMQFFIDNEVKMGWNMGNTLDAVANIGSSSIRANETAWGNPIASQALLNGVKESGFDIVRIPCTWIGHIGPAPNYKINESRLARVAEVVGYAKTAGFKAVIINIHHDGNTASGRSPRTWGFLDLKAAAYDDAKKMEIQKQLGKVWTQIAEYFKNYGDYLIFETMNEVHSGNWGSVEDSDAYRNEQDILFDWNQAALSAIRATGGNNAARFIAVPTLGSTEPGYVINAHSRNKLLPNDKGNGTKKLIVSVHYYHPWRYTVASATTQTAGQTLLHTWGTDSERAHPVDSMSSLKETFLDKGIAVYIGEWGAPTNVRNNMSTEIKNTHCDYIKSVASAARANGIVPICWDDGGDFKIFERLGSKPKTGLWADTLSAMMTNSD